MPEKSVYKERINTLIESMKRSEIDALLMNRLGNIAYLTGAVNSCSWFILTKEGKSLVLLLESDYESYKEQSVIDDIRTFRSHDPIHLFKEITQELELENATIGLELGRPGISQSLLAVLRHAFPPGVALVNGEELVEKIRAVKSAEEIEAIKDAVTITELGMETAIAIIKPGIREQDVLLEVEYAMRKAGGRIPVVSYISSGKRSGMAHHTASEKKIENGDVVTLDIHGAFHGYCADLARTIVCGKIDTEVRQAYSSLIKAEEEAIDLCRDGEKLTSIRKIFYKCLSNAKNMKFLTGPVLHGVGIMNAELPSFRFPNQTRGIPEIMRKNMVIAISNIGLYSNQGWGVRVEDTVVVGEGEPLYLTQCSKDLLSV